MCRENISGKDLQTDELKEEIILQLRANWRNEGWDWTGTVLEFINSHIIEWEEELERMPSWVKESNLGKSQIITIEDEIKRSEDTLQLLNEIPKGSLISRAYK